MLWPEQREEELSLMSTRLAKVTAICTVIQWSSSFCCCIKNGLVRHFSKSAKKDINGIKSFNHVSLYIDGIRKKKTKMNAALKVLLLFSMSDFPHTSESCLTDDGWLCQHMPDQKEFCIHPTNYNHDSKTQLKSIHKAENNNSCWRLCSIEIDVNNILFKSMPRHFNLKLMYSILNRLLFS